MTAEGAYLTPVRRSGAEPILRRAVWVGLAVLMAVEVAEELWPGQMTAVHVARSVLMVLVVARLVSAVRARPAQRGALVALAVGQISWAAGSVIIASTTDPEVTTLPLSPAEVLFLGAFVGFAAFVFLDAHGRPIGSAVRWLEAAVLAGAAACVAAVAMLLPAADRIGSAGLPLLLALLYPLSDVLLVVALIAQVGLRQRSPDQRTMLLILGFTVLAAVDAAFASRLAEGRYAFTLAMNLAWAVSPVIVAQAACMPIQPVTEAPNRRYGSIALLVSATIAAVVLALHYPPELQIIATSLATFTLAAVALRVALAFREARRTADAYRSSLRDDLTGLANRRGIAAAIGRLPHAAKPAMLLIGIDAFRDVNESLGHATGDSVLALFGDRLRQAVPDHVVIGRLEGDAFAVVLENGQRDGLMRSADEVRRVLGAPVRVAGLEVVLTVAVGVAVAAPGESANELLRRSLVAMTQAKRSPTGVATYDPVKDGLSREHLRNAEALRRALNSEEFEVWYQPQVDARTRHIVGLEALVRWRRPGSGVMSPEAFLPTARRAGLMPALTEAVLGRVVTDVTRWYARGHDWHVAVNIAPPELLSGFVVPQVQALVGGFGLPAGSLVVEVTEDSFLADPERAKEVLQALHAVGVEVSVDDFGTGFSSLAYLRDIHAQELKIDRSFVTAMTSDERCAMIVESTTQMAQGLGLRVVAEGVEDEATAQALMEIGIDVLQGYLIARPMPAEALMAWVAAYRSR